LRSCGTTKGGRFACRFRIHVRGRDFTIRSFDPKSRRCYALQAASSLLPDAERRAFEGELALLEAAWREAEEIAAISDDMFVSEETRSRLSKLKRADEA
jgi:hypothetical protein